MLGFGISDRFAGPVFPGAAGELFDIVQDYAGTLVFLCVTIAAIRRLVFRPARYRQPAGSGKYRAADAIFLLALIGLLMAADGLFKATEPDSRRRSRALPYMDVPERFGLRVALP